jgi:hypothetical protein
MFLPLYGIGVYLRHSSSSDVIGACPCMKASHSLMREWLECSRKQNTPMVRALNSEHMIDMQDEKYRL